MKIQTVIEKLVNGHDVSPNDISFVIGHVHEATHVQIGGLIAALYMRWKKECPHADRG